MAKLRKLVTYTTYRWEEVELTEEQLVSFKNNKEDFIENYYEGEYDLDWDLVKEDYSPCEEEDPVLIEDED